jgi:pimeloyl-ACP methyl ester carboxylesterase
MVGTWLSLVGVLLVIGLLWWAVVVTMMAFVLICPRRMGDARAVVELGRLSPGDLGLEFEEMGFGVIDQQTDRKLQIAGWWIPAAAEVGPRDRCAVIVHGYSDAKVGGIAWAPVLRSLGFHILAIDLRAHGESGGKYCTAGFWERHDLGQVIDQIRASRPNETREMVLFGISIGAAVVAATAVMRDDLAAVILECPFADFTKAVSYQANRIGMPGPMFQRMTYRIAQWVAGCDFSVVRPVELIPKIPAPLMLIQACDDPFLSKQDLADMREAVMNRPASRGPSVYRGLEDVHHVVGICENPEEYRRRIEDFLVHALPTAGAVCEK